MKLTKEQARDLAVALAGHLNVSPQYAAERFNEMGSPEATFWIENVGAILAAAIEIRLVAELGPRPRFVDLRDLGAGPVVEE